MNKVLKTQQFKSVSIRDIVNAAMEGRPINADFSQLYDLQDVDVDDDREILSEFDDDMDVIQSFRDFQSSQINLNQKGGIDSDEQIQKDKKKIDEKEASLSEK